jgi:hypothetical protein
VDLAGAPGQQDPAEDRGCADQLQRRSALTQRRPPRQGADDRLQVHERAGQLRGGARLPVGKQPEGEHRPRQRQGRKGQQRPRAGGRAGQTLGRRGNGGGECRRGCELHRGDRGGIAAGKQRGLDHDEDRRQRHRREHEQIAAEAGARR